MHLNYEDVQCNRVPNNKIIHTFSIDELNTLEKWETRIERLNNARNWLIFGCNTGQRVEDLLNITLKTVKNRQ